MTFKLKLLSAAALLVLPVVAAAQTPAPQPAPQPGTTMENVNETVRSAQDTQQQAAPPAGEQIQDEQPRQADQTPPQPANSADSPPAPSATQQQPAGTDSQARPPAEAQPPAATQAGTQTQVNAQVQAGATRIASAADVTAGAQVRDTAGAPVGTVETVDADSAVVSTGSVRADIPISSFGHNGQNLVLAMTRAQLEAAARAATRTPTG